MSPLDLFALLAGADPGYLAVTYPDGVTFCPTDSPSTFRRHLEVLTYDPGDLEVGAVPYRQPSFERVGWSNVLWVQCDTGRESMALRAFRPEPSFVLRWGVRSVGLWALSQALNPSWTENLNKRLAHAVGSKKKHASPWFRFPPAGTVLRAGKPRVVECVGGCGGLYGAREVAGGLPEAPDPAETFRRHLARSA